MGRPPSSGSAGGFVCARMVEVQHRKLRPRSGRLFPLPERPPSCRRTHVFVPRCISSLTLSARRATFPRSLPSSPRALSRRSPARQRQHLRPPRGRSPRDARSDEQPDRGARRGAVQAEEGPCYQIVTDETFLVSSDLAHDDRWTRFGRIAADAGFPALLAVLLTADGTKRRSALNVYASSPHEYDREQRRDRSAVRIACVRRHGLCRHLRTARAARSPTGRSSGRQWAS